MYFEYFQNSFTFNKKMRNTKSVWYSWFLKYNDFLWRTRKHKRILQQAITDEANTHQSKSGLQWKIFHMCPWTRTRTITSKFQYTISAKKYFSFCRQTGNRSKQICHGSADIWWDFGRKQRIYSWTIMQDAGVSWKAYKITVAIVFRYCDI